MRLFVALPLEAQALRALAAIQEKVRPRARRADFTPAENLHLTLAFIGETDRADAAAACVRQTAAAFSFAIEGVGRFRRADGDLLWAAVGKAPALERLQAQVVCSLRGAGFRLEDRPFRPHVTLARRVEFAKKDGFEALQKMFPPGRVLCETCAEWVSLFCSARSGGRQVYTEMATERLER